MAFPDSNVVPMEIEAAAQGNSEAHRCTLQPDQTQVTYIGSTFKEHEIRAATLKPVFDAFEKTKTNASVDLGMLADLRKQDVKFLPSSIYVRQPMREIFDRFRRDVEITMDSDRVLLGSPGVGKSVLFFLAAAYKCLTGDFPVVYTRRTREENRISAFVMVRAATNDLTVYTCRNIKKNQFTRIPDLVEGVASCFGWNDLDEYLSFLDGPRHDADVDLNSCYHYFCTSGGHPLPHNAQKDLFLWILDGWSSIEAVEFGISRNQEAEFSEAYSIVGGCVRDMVEYVDAAVDKRARNRIVSTLVRLCRRVANKNIDLVLTTTTRNKDSDSGNPDRLRMMFNGNSLSEDIPDPVQIVDSGYALRALHDRQTLESLLAALQKAKLIKSGTVVGVYFEELLHQWFKNSRPCGIKGAFVASGSWTESVQRLADRGKNYYWIPESPNFPNIDAAVVINNVLYVIQYTKRSDRGFNVSTFWQNFVSVVREKIVFDAVHVYIVLIDKVSSDLKVEFTMQWKASSGTGSTSTLVDIGCTSSYVNVDTASVDTVRQTAGEGFCFLLSMQDDSSASPPASSEETAYPPAASAGTV